jgi:hypothetical protein
MRTKEWVYLNDEKSIGCYREVSLDKNASESAMISISSPQRYQLAYSRPNCQPSQEITVNQSHVLL